MLHTSPTRSIPSPPISSPPLNSLSSPPSQLISHPSLPPILCCKSPQDPPTPFPLFVSTGFEILFNNFGLPFPHLVVFLTSPSILAIGSIGSKLDETWGEEEGEGKENFEDLCAGRVFGGRLNAMRG